jgi:hypothetical protein
MRQIHSIRSLRALAYVMLLTLASARIAVASSDAVTITRVSGTVQIAVAGRTVAAQSGGRIGLPAKIQTGADGSLRVEQPSSTLDIGPNSTVLLPAPGGTSEKIIQNLGRVLYSVKPRKARTFAVETPYLVSVVKGTVFSVSIDEGATSVSLLEGSVELVADGIETVLLQPNETARHGANDHAINVTKIDMTPPQAGATPFDRAPTATSRPEFTRAADATLADLNEIASVRRDVGAVPAIQPPPAPNTPTPEGPTTPSGPGSAPVPSTPSTPAPEAPTPGVPNVPPAPTPGVDPAPVPSDDDDCGKKHCDSDDDDHGGGNDKDEDKD